MTDAQRRYMRARQAIEENFLNPLNEFRAAATGLAAAEKARADQAEVALAALRPVWAQGFTSDSEAAQANGAALGEIWEFLGVTDQTAAMKALRAMEERAER